MFASHLHLPATLLNAFARLFDAGDGASSAWDVSAFGGWAAIPDSPIARCSLPATAKGDVTLWRITHGPRRQGAPGFLTREDHAEFARLGPDACVRARAVRSLLRRALSVAVDDQVAPLAWRFSRSEYGKPTVADGLPLVHFSTTHTRGISLIATSRHSNVGIDAEAAGVEAWEPVAGSTFSRQEHAMLNSAPKCQREEAFLRIWTAKEARAKLVGTGLAYEIAGNDCGPGMRLATWVDESPSARMVVSLAVHGSAPGGGGSEGRANNNIRRK